MKQTKKPHGSMHNAYWRLAIFTGVLVCFTFPTSVAQTPGCTDTQASNYNANATRNDGSCQFPATGYAPVSRAALAPELAETSGLAFGNEVLWTHTDNGPQAIIYQIDTNTQRILKRVTLGNLLVSDVEDIAVQGDFLYLGDIGNNATGTRRDLRILRVPLNAIPAGTDVQVPNASVGEIRFSYPDQTDFSQPAPNKTAFDCEAFFVHNGLIHLFTKNWLTNETTHYTLPATLGNHVATKRQTFSVNGLITAADRANNGTVALTGYNASNGAVFTWLLYDYPPDNVFGGHKRRIDLGNVARVGQVEGVAFRSSNMAYISNEFFELSSGTIQIRVPAQLWNFSVGDWVKTTATRGVTAEASFCEDFLAALASHSTSLEQYTLFIHSSEGKLLWRGERNREEPTVLPKGVYQYTYRTDKVICQKRVMFWH